MSFDIGFPFPKSNPFTLTAPSTLAFEDDGYYWFCYVYFGELAVRTGQMIDLYGSAEFDGDVLTELEATIAMIAEKARGNPPTLDVCTGHSMGSVSNPTSPIPVYASVSREELLSLLSRFADLSADTKRLGYAVVCAGD